MGKAGRQQTEVGAQTKAQRRQVRAARGRGEGAAASASPQVPGKDASRQERIEWRIAQIEEAVATQSECNDRMLDMIERMLQGARNPPARRQTESGPEGDRD